jgi:hypothetical protein
MNMVGRRLVSVIIGVAALAWVVAGACESDGLIPGQMMPTAGRDGGVGGHAGGGATASIDGGAGRPPGGFDAGAPFACGPSGTLVCSCGDAFFFPAPTNDAGQPQTYGSKPDGGADFYTTVGEFDALAVGRWRRTAGEGEIHCEQYGIDFTSDHRMIPLVIASDGSVQPVPAQAISFGISFANPNIGPAFADDGGAYASAPAFFDAGQVMMLLYAPWPADYVRVN